MWEGTGGVLSAIRGALGSFGRLARLAEAAMFGWDPPTASRPKNAQVPTKTHSLGGDWLWAGAIRTTRGRQSLAPKPLPLDFFNRRSVGSNDPTTAKRTSQSPPPPKPPLLARTPP